MPQLPWSTFDPSGEKGPDFLSGQEKAEWEDEGRSFTITRIDKVKAREVDGKDYDPQWVLWVTDAYGNERRLGFGLEERRDTAMTAAQASIAEGNTIGPVALKSVQTKSGRPYWTLVDGQAMAEARAFSAPVDNTDIDDLPF